MIGVIRDKILNYTGTDWVPIVIVGNKTDLQGQRQVTREEGEELAAKWKCLSCETSAKTNLNIGKRKFEAGQRKHEFFFFLEGERRRERAREKVDAVAVVVVSVVVVVVVDVAVVVVVCVCA